MDDPSATPTPTVTTEQPPAILFARTPAELKQAHDGLETWADTKLAELDQEVRDLSTSMNLALDAKLPTAALDRALRRAERRHTFYTKVKAALAAGYLVVPNFPMDTFAIRTTAKTVKGGTRRNWDWRPNEQFAQPAQQRLGVGAGAYVGAQAKVQRWSQAEQRDPAKPERGTRYYVKPVGFDDVDVPAMALGVPAVMSATIAALQAKIFDEIGIARDASTGGDPMILGRLINPRHKWAQPVTFFVAWFFDPRRV